MVPGKLLCSLYLEIHRKKPTRSYQGDPLTTVLDAMESGPLLNERHGEIHGLDSYLHSTPLAELLYIDA